MELNFDQHAIHRIKEYLISHKQTICTAESVTAGFMQAALASAERATDFFEGGITVYNIDQKVRHLNIDRTKGEECNCVSSEIARQMAEGSLKLFQSDWGISITGYATPVKESNFKLYAYYSLCSKEGELATGKIDLAHKKPEEAQLEYVNVILQKFSALLSV